MSTRRAHAKSTITELGSSDLPRLLSLPKVTNAQIEAIPGWLSATDVAAFRLLLTLTCQWLPGDLAELGVYRGKSAVLLGSYLQRGETLTVVDLFGEDAADAPNRAENQEQYPELTREQFERTYRDIFGGKLPNVIQGYSSTIGAHAAHGTHRFVHVDASHLYEHVAADLVAARTLLSTDGVVVLDDYRSDHAPGVAAAAWRAVADGLHPFLLTPMKMYATWGDTAKYRRAVDAWAKDTKVHHEHQVIGGDQVLVIPCNTSTLARLVPPAALPALNRMRARWGDLPAVLRRR